MENTASANRPRGHGFTAAIAGLTAAMLLGSAAIAWSADAPATETPSLVDSQVDITLASGETLTNTKVVRVREAGKTIGSFYTITIADKTTGKSVVLPAARVREVCAPGGRPLLIYDPTRKMLVPPTQASAKAKPEEQGDTSVRLQLSDDQQKAAVEKQRALLEEAGQKIPNRGMRLHETKRFLFYSDVSPQIITSIYVPYLDAMYTQLCGIYGIDPNINIWKGKATIVVYADKVNFINFQHTYFGDPELGYDNVAGLANLRPGGEVVITAYATNDAKFFAVLLVHETTHGFTFRYFAQRRVPSWLHEGISDYLANQVVPTHPEVRRRVERSIEQMRRTHTVGSQFFSATKSIDAEQYGTATSFVNFLLTYNPKAPAGKPGSKSRRQEASPTSFRQFQEKLRAGTPWEASLQEAYGMTLAELVQRFGQSIGVPDLRP